MTSLGAALAAVVAGIMPMAASIVAVLSVGGRTGGVPRMLTGRQHQVLGLVVEGLSNKQIGHRLVISTEAAKAHVANIL